MSDLTNKAGSEPLAWKLVGTPDFDMKGQKPVMAEASNHIRECCSVISVFLTHLTLSVHGPVFFNVPENKEGSANVFVIHCKSRHVLNRREQCLINTLYSDEYFQPEVQEFEPVNNAAATFPTVHGRTAQVPLTNQDVSLTTRHVVITSSSMIMHMTGGFANGVCP